MGAPGACARCVRVLSLLVLNLLAACAGGNIASTPAGTLSAETATSVNPHEFYPAMGQISDSRQMLAGKARSLDDGMVVIFVASDPGVADAFFNSWNISNGFDEERFVRDMIRWDLQTDGLQACFIAVAPENYDESFREIVPQVLRDDDVFLGIMRCLDDEEDKAVLMAQDWDESVKGIAFDDEGEVLVTVMFNGSRENFANWSLELLDDENGSGWSKGSRKSDDEPDV